MKVKVIMALAVLFEKTEEEIADAKATKTLHFIRG